MCDGSRYDICFPGPTLGDAGVSAAVEVCLSCRVSGISGFGLSACVRNIGFEVLYMNANRVWGFRISI